MEQIKKRRDYKEKNREGEREGRKQLGKRTDMTNRTGREKRR